MFMFFPGPTIFGACPTLIFIVEDFWSGYSGQAHRSAHYWTRWLDVAAERPGRELVYGFGLFLLEQDFGG